MAVLTTKKRNKLPASEFAGPDRSYPVNDKAHARNAKARAAQFASPAEKAKIDAKADRVLGAAKGMTEVPDSTKKTVPGKRPPPGPIKPDVLGSMVKSLRS